MKNKILIFLLLALAGFSCKKEHKETIIDGIVRDYTTGQPLEGVEVYLQMGEYHDVDHPYENVKTFQSFVTGADGKFHTEFKALKHYTYGLEYQKPSQCYFDNDNGYKVNTSTTNNIDIKLHSYATLYLHVKNVSPYDSNDHICLTFSKSSTGCLDPGSTGASVDYMSSLNLDAYKVIFIKSFITKNGITTTRLDSVAMSPCTNQTYNLFY